MFITPSLKMFQSELHTKENNTLQQLIKTLGMHTTKGWISTHPYLYVILGEEKHQLKDYLRQSKCTVAVCSTRSINSPRSDLKIGC